MKRPYSYEAHWLLAHLPKKYWKDGAEFFHLPLPLVEAVAKDLEEAYEGEEWHEPIMPLVHGLLAFCAQRGGKLCLIGKGQAIEKIEERLKHLESVGYSYDLYFWA